jgi:hypothetical protein
MGEYFSLMLRDTSVEEPGGGVLRRRKSLSCFFVRFIEYLMSYSSALRVASAVNVLRNTRKASNMR